jgi:hypothetical protein
MRLVDSATEQELLERLLEKSKPPLPVIVTGRDYLLSTPFRYVSPWPSRFRRVGESGIWYGAHRVETACAEVGYWRWRFLMESDGLREQTLFIEFTVFQARVEGIGIDLTQLPWLRASALWTHPTDYTACQALATAARRRDVQWIRYASVRDPNHGPAGAVLHPCVLSLPRATVQQNWAARVQRDVVAFSHGGDTIEFQTSR